MTSVFLHLNYSGNMQLKNIEDYLSDKKFDEGLKIRFQFDKERVTRAQKIVSLITGKKVIHVGCVDHMPIIEEKIRNGTWLHKLVTNVAEECIGVDINEKGIEFMKSIGYTNAYYADLMHLSLPEINLKQWDYMILGEILEHVDNPCDFLKRLNKLYENNVQKIIITVPNAFCEYNFRNIQKGFEMINSDHRSTFTPYTLNKILHIGGFTLNDIFFVEPIYRFRHLVYNKLRGKKVLSIHPGLSKGLVAIASFK
jgi:2-polyprenyl-3-methyl-5-hydroxy-6-metoxy-1,4-benzoquinol methylase